MSPTVWYQVCDQTAKISQDWHHFIIFDVVSVLTNQAKDPQEKRLNNADHAFPVIILAYWSLLSSFQSSFKFKHMGEGCEWKTLRRKAGACYFGHNEID